MSIRVDMKHSRACPWKMPAIASAISLARDILIKDSGPAIVKPQPDLIGAYSSHI